MRPGTLLLRIALVLCALALFVPVLPELAAVLLLALLGLAAVAFLEWRFLRRVTVKVESPAAVVISVDEDESIPFTVTAATSRPLQLTVRQSWPSIIDASSEVRTFRIAPGEVIGFSATVRAASRGSVELPPAYVSATRWGLIERIRVAGTASTISVIPNIKAVGRLHKQMNAFILRGLGNRTAPRLGKGREFDRLREYVTDDDYRDIAWRASARHNKLIVREYRLDRSQEVVICIDRGHRMAARVGSLRRLDHAINATLLLSYVSNRMEDRVGVVSFADTVQNGTGAARGATHLRSITRYVTELQPEYRFTDYIGLAASVRRMLHHRSLILIMTVLAEPEERMNLIQAVKMLVPQHLPLVLVMADAQLQALASSRPANKHELCQTLAARELWQDRVALMKELRSRGAIVVETTPERAPVAAVNAYIDVKRRQLL